MVSLRVDIEFKEASTYSAPAAYTGPEFKKPYAGAFGGDGNFYVGSGVPEKSVNSQCGTWPPAGYSTIFKRSEGPVARDQSDTVGG